MTLSNETADGLIYKGENSYITNVIYSFTGSKLTAAACLIPNTHVSLLGSFLAERYVVVKSDQNKNRIYYVSPDQKLAIVVEVASIAYSLVAYAPMTSSKSADIQIDATLDQLHSSLEWK